VGRNAPTLLALVLLVATATAFAVTQRLKLEPSPISQTRVADVFSPVCECATRAASIEFSLRKADRLRIAIRVGASEVTVADGSFRRGLVHARWNGRDASGVLVPDGVYYPVVHLEREDRTIDLPNPIRVDTQEPTITLTSVSSTGVESVRPKWILTYRVSEPAHALLFVDGRRAVYTYSTRRRGRLKWYGQVNGHLVHPPRSLVLVAEDLAGNRSDPARVKSA
jgi:hypothetical protein